LGDHFHLAEKENKKDKNTEFGTLDFAWRYIKDSELLISSKQWS
jgi:hypothetical protein